MPCHAMPASLPASLPAHFTKGAFSFYCLPLRCSLPPSLPPSPSSPPSSARAGALRLAQPSAHSLRFMAAATRLASFLPTVNVRRSFLLGSQAVPTASAVSAFTSIPAASRFSHFDARSRSQFNFSRRVETSGTFGGLQRPIFCRCCLFGLLRSQLPLQAPDLSRCYAVVQPYPEDLKMDQGSDEKVGTEEVVEGCLVQHGELWNEDVKIHYVECGDKNGDLVVLLHGFPNFWYVWKNQFQALAEAGYHVVAPDLRGYNSSSKLKGVHNYSRRSVVSDIVRVIDQLGNGKRATVVGHDWGGILTWAIAEDFPDKMKKAVVINAPHLAVFDEVVRSNFNQICRSWYIWFFQLPLLPEWFMFGRNFAVLKASFTHTKCQPIDIDRHVTAYGKAGPAEGPINYYRAAMRGYWAPAPDVPEPIRVELPVDLIWGELDQFLRKELAVIPKEIAPNAVVKRLPHCSHWPMWEDPKQFNALLLESVNSERATSGDQFHRSTVMTDDDN